MENAADRSGDPLAHRLNATVTAFLDERSAALLAVGPELAMVAEEARRFVLDGGKRLRPRFAYWGWRSVRGVDVNDAGLITAAAALELLHCCALVHDDVMDASATRRGRPSTHAAFAALHRSSGWTGDAEVYGNASAILLGDLLLSWSDMLFAAADLPSDARRVYDETRQLLMAGQYLDVLVQARGDFSAEDAVRVAQFKTSKYTVEGPLRLGATAGGAPADVLCTLSDYAIPVGEAFQLRDDVLGVFGDPVETGKPAGDDLLEGKRTLLVALAMQHAAPAEAELIRRELGDRTMDGSRLHDLRAVIVGSGALDLVEQRIAARTAEARAALRTGPISAESAAALDLLAVAASQRTT